LWRIKFTIWQPEKNGITRCPKGVFFFFGKKKKGLKSPYVEGEKKGLNSPYLVHRVVVCHQYIVGFFFFPIFSCCFKSGDQPQEDLAKSGYKTNREAENLGIQSRVEKPAPKMEPPGILEDRVSAQGMERRRYYCRCCAGAAAA